MKKHQLNEWLSLTANIAVVAGIIFLAVEIRQNNELLRSEARYHLLTNIVEAVTDSYTNETVMSAWLKVEDGQEVTAEEKFSLLRYNYTMFRKFEWEYQQYRNGLIDEGDLPVHSWINIYESQPLMIEAWQQYGFRHSENFRLFMDQNVVNR